MKDIITIVENHYNCNAIKYVERAGGLSQENYFIYTYSEQYFIKLYKPSEKDIAEKICKITEFFYENNIPTTLPLYNKYSNQVTEIEDYIILMYLKLNGSTLHQGDFDDNAFSSTAKILALIHNTTHNLHKIDNQLFLADWNANIQDFEDKLKDIKRQGDIDYLNDNEVFLVKNYISLKHELLQKLSSEKEWYNTFNASQNQIIHGDFHNENLLFDSQNNIIAVIDFANTSLGNPVIDIFSFINHACFHNGFTPNNITKAKYFINEYQKYNITLTQQDIISGLYLATANWCSSLFFEKKLYKEKAANFISYIKRDIKKLRFIAHFINLNNKL